MLFLIILKWPLFLVAGQLERLIFRLSWSLKLFMVSKTKTYFSTNLKKCQLPSSCLRFQCPRSYDICWLQCVSRSFRAYEIISYSLLHMSSLRNCPLKYTQPLESFTNGGLFQLHPEKSAITVVCLSAHGVQPSGPGRECQHTLTEMCLLWNSTALEIHWGSRCNKRSRNKTLLIKQYL